ncbi:MAG: FtsW/RodA/SpoVE family cell cycle protein [Muribaculaceae bacterium]|jgi:cell division protein FtsW|nr:FtsW/RodA/SpoVE family cell cycle protein [Muribaculaceae bacterium]
MTAEKRTHLNEIAQRHGDPWIWGIYIMLVIISIVESYSASSREIASQGVYMPLIKQCVFLAVGAVCVFLLHRWDYNKSQFLFLMIPVLAIVTVISLIYVLLFGEVINGAQRAITLVPGFMTVQPAELAKLSIVTLLSYIMAKNQKNRDISNTGMIISGVAVAIFGVLMISSGLTNTLLLMAISVSMLLIGGARVKKILLLFGFYIIIGGLFYVFKHNNEHKDEIMQQNTTMVQTVDSQGDTVYVSAPTQDASGGGRLRDATWRNRIKAWWYSDSLVYRPLTNKNQQEMFSRMAQAHGGIKGVGIGQSRECSRLPLAFSDYIFSIIIEETGLIGGIFVLLLYLWLLARAAMIVKRSRRVLPSLLIIGMASLITYQALFHMAINVGVFPVSGQPLPLVSKGGTSIIVMSVAFGIMLSVSRTIANYNNKNNKVEESVLPEGLDAENPTQIVPKNVWK